MNAIGNGVADDKGIYPFVPDMIRFYLGEEPILPQVQTYVCARESDCRYVLEHVECPDDVEFVFVRHVAGVQLK